MPPDEVYIDRADFIIQFWYCQLVKFDEFEEKFKELKEEFRLINGKYPETIKEFETYLFQRKYNRRKQGKSLKSLKGFDF